MANPFCIKSLPQQPPAGCLKAGMKYTAIDERLNQVEMVRAGPKKRIHILDKHGPITRLGIYRLNSLRMSYVWTLVYPADYDLYG